MGEERRERRERRERVYIYIYFNRSHTQHTYTVLMNGSRVKACGVMAVSLLLSIFL